MSEPYTHSKLESVMRAAINPAALTRYRNKKNPSVLELINARIDELEKNTGGLPQGAVHERREELISLKRLIEQMFIEG